MPDRPFTVVTYAASASLAAIALVYFFNPNHLFDSDSSPSSASTRKKGVVGLVNSANDCFINSILQSLAGLGDLRLYLIREVHRRELSDPVVYTSVPTKDKDGKEIEIAKLASLQSGEVTQGLKLMIDRLNERPIYKKSISPWNFVRVLEHAFATRISRTQQDAQELLQVVAERLAEEYHAGREARRRAAQGWESDEDTVIVNDPSKDVADLRDKLEGRSRNTQSPEDVPHTPGSVKAASTASFEEEEDGFPLEGQTEATIECQRCHFKPKSKPSNFVMLNLMVPNKSTTTLNDCFDAHFKTEFIDDYKCDKCRLNHAVSVFVDELRVACARSDFEAEFVRSKIEKVQDAVRFDPEKPPKDVKLPDISLAPKRRIARSVQVTKFPKVLVVHLSRSVYDPGCNSTKNLAKVSFPEKLALGGLLNRRNYKLLGMVTHKGTHNSGHYESFRRQHLYAPTSTPHKKRDSGPYSNVGSPNPSTKPGPSLPTQNDETNDPASNSKPAENSRPSTDDSSTPSTSLNSLDSTSTRPSSGSFSGVKLTKPPPAAKPDPQPSNRDSGSTDRSAPLTHQPDPQTSAKRSSLDLGRLRRRRKTSDRWWRISDDKIKECTTSDVLAMQKDVYMLFYEMERAE